MEIKGVFQAPMGTVLVFSENLPDNKLGKYLDIETKFYKILGVPTDDNRSILIEKATEIKAGQNAEIFESTS